MKHKIRLKLSVIFGTLGYLSLILQWGWALILLLPPLLKMNSVQTFIMPKSLPVAHSGSGPIVLSPILTYTLVTVAFIITILGIYFALKSPAIAVKKVDATAKKTATTIAHRAVKRPENSREVRALSTRILWTLKAGAVLIGLILTFLGTFITSGLSRDIIVTIGAYLAMWPILWFGAQYLVEPRKVTKQ